MLVFGKALVLQVLAFHGTLEGWALEVRARLMSRNPNYFYVGRRFNEVCTLPMHTQARVYAHARTHAHDQMSGSNVRIEYPNRCADVWGGRNLMLWCMAVALIESLYQEQGWVTPPQEVAFHEHEHAEHAETCLHAGSL